MYYLENHIWYAELSKGFLILGHPYQNILQLGVLLKFLHLSSQNQLLQIDLKSDLKTLFQRLAILLS